VAARRFLQVIERYPLIRDERYIPGNEALKRDARVVRKIQCAGFARRPAQAD
jgi:hypothetical protein